MMKEEISIGGMSCGHCIMAVKKELQKLEAVTVFDVQIGKAIVEYDESTTNRAAIDNAIRTAGYQPA